MAPRSDRGGPPSGGRGRAAPGGGQSRGGRRGQLGGQGTLQVGHVTQGAHVDAVGVKRRDFGTSGRRIQILTNHFETSTPQEPIFHYDAITPSEHSLPQRLNYSLINQLQTVVASNIFTPRAVYDGKKNMWAARELPLGSTKSQEFDVTLPEDSERARAPKVYKIQIKFAVKINPEVLNQFIRGNHSLDNVVLTGIMASNVVIRMQPIQQYPFNLRSFFTSQESKMMQGGLEVWRGYFQSVRPGIQRLTINIDITSAVMFKPGSLIDVCLDFFGRSRNPNLLANGIPDRERIRLQRFLSGVRVLIKRAGAANTERPMARTIRKLSTKGADSLTFTTREGVSLTVAEHFQRNQQRLRHPNLLCVEVGTGALIPLEMCSIPKGQIMRKQLPPERTKDVVEFATKRPAERLASIRQGLGILQYGQSEYVRQFGLNVKEEPLQISARVLQPPNLKYGRGSKQPNITPRNGAWNMADKKFYKPANIGHWLIVCFDPRFQNQLRSFAESFIKGCRAVGMDIQDNPQITMENGQGRIRERLMAAGRKLHNERKVGPSLFVVILPEGGNDIYTAVKHFGDCVMGVPTQCLKSAKCMRANDQYYANVALKVNVKMGGINVIPDQASAAASSLLDPMNPTVIMGADVIHPAPGSTGRPSFASIVASVDAEVARYIAVLGVQTGRQEAIADFQSMAKEVLKMSMEYQKGNAPKRIIFYRDGVSEGQFRQVLDNELLALKSACRELKINPNITMIIVGKRHHTRFFPTSQSDADRSGNCPAGTVVDTDIAHPIEFDFFLQSHAGILGTSRSAHYSVLYDDNKFNPDGLQSLTYALCHVYARATRSVSIPAPVYYADIVCSRAKNHYDPEGNLNLETTSVDTAETDTLEAFRANFVPLHRNQQKLMYFS